MKKSQSQLIIPSLIVLSILFSILIITYYSRQQREITTTTTTTSITITTVTTTIVPGETTTTMTQCLLLNAYWSKSSVIEGEWVELKVEGQNCDGKTVSLSYWEDDETYEKHSSSITGKFFDIIKRIFRKIFALVIEVEVENDPINPDEYNLPKTITFDENTASATWQTRWFEDTDGKDEDPEIFFEASLEGSLVRSDILKITKIIPTTSTIPDKNIKLIKEGTKDGYYYWLYENTKYPCGKSGNHEFLVFQKGGSKDKRNLLVRFHGGAAGFFKSDGSYVPKEGFKAFLYAKKERGVMFNTALGDGLTKLFREQDDWRVLVPSYCSHDFYIGKGQYSEFDGFSRWGYFAAQEAINFVQEKFLTDKIITYGTSAGASGAFYHGYQRNNVMGIVMDSNSMDLSSMKTNCERGISTCCGKDVDICECFDLGKSCVEMMAERVGFELGKDEPHLMIERDEINKPIYFIWNTNDRYYKGENAKYYMENLDKNIKLFNPGGKSVAKQVCVTCPNCKNPCTVHSPTKQNIDETYEVYHWINSLIEKSTPEGGLLYGVVNAYLYPFDESDGPAIKDRLIYLKSLGINSVVQIFKGIPLDKARIFLGGLASGQE